MNDISALFSFLFSILRQGLAKVSRLASNCNPLAPSSGIAGIIGMCHCTWPISLTLMLRFQQELGDSPAFARIHEVYESDPIISTTKPTHFK